MVSHQWPKSVGFGFSFLTSTKTGCGCLVITSMSAGHTRHVLCPSRPDACTICLLNENYMGGQATAHCWWGERESSQDRPTTSGFMFAMVYQLDWSDRADGRHGTEQTCIIAAQYEWAKRPSTRGRQTDRDREGDQATHAETCGHSVGHSDWRPAMD